MKVIEILIYGLGVLEFPFDESIKNCHLNASAIYDNNGVEHFTKMDPPEFGQKVITG